MDIHQAGWHSLASPLWSPLLFISDISSAYLRLLSDWPVSVGYPLILFNIIPTMEASQLLNGQTEILVPTCPLLGPLQVLLHFRNCPQTYYSLCLEFSSPDTSMVCSFTSFLCPSNSGENLPQHSTQQETLPLPIVFYSLTALVSLLVKWFMRW